MSCKLWIVLVVAAIVSLACSFSFSGSRPLANLRTRNIISMGSSTENIVQTATAIVVLPPSPGVVRTVMKFGGSSLATADRVTYVAQLIAKHYELGYRPTVVCSAMGKTTNALLTAGDQALKGEVNAEVVRALHISTADELGLPSSVKDTINAMVTELEKLLEGIRCIGELTPRTKDYLVSFGERMSVRIMAATLNKMNVPSQAFDSWTLGMHTTSEFGNAEIKEETYDKMKGLMSKLDSDLVPIVTGFIGHDDDGRITTLGRGGSDLTATVIGTATGVDEIQVWKDVDGIMSTDPRLVKAAIPVTHVTYEEAAELAYFGAEVLHPIAMQPAIRSQIPVRVKNSYNPSAVGTAITMGRDKSSTLVTAITSKNSVQLVDIVSTRMLGQYGFLAEVFRCFQECGISVDVIASSEVSLSLTLDKKQVVKDTQRLLSKLNQFAETTVFEDRAIVTLISNLDRSSEVMAIAFQVMDKLGITVEMFSQGASKVNISFVIQAKDREAVIKALHACFFEGKSPADMERTQRGIQEY